MTERGVKLQKIDGDIKVRFHKRLSEACELRNMTVTKDRLGRYFVSIGVIEPIKQLDPIDAKIGIDLGLTHHTVLSNGEKVDNPRFFDKHFKQLRRAQRKLSRRKKGSKNREKARHNVARIHAKITWIVGDIFYTSCQRDLIRESQAIGVETLRVKKYDEKPTTCPYELVMCPGRSLYACGGIQRHDVGEWYGRRVKKLNAYYPSSKTCFKTVIGCAVTNSTTSHCISVNGSVQLVCGIHHDL